eukprot:831274-Prorocentrum_minimum.AAC.1
MSLQTPAEVLQVGSHGALTVDDGHGGGVFGEPEDPLVRSALLRLVPQHPLKARVELTVIAAGVGGAQICWVPLHESVVISMTTSCCARSVGDVHGDVRMRGVGAQELVHALLRMPRVEA